MSFLTPLKSQIAAAVIVYNRFENLQENIESYVTQVDKLYVIDNSDNQSVLSSEYFDDNPSVAYIANIGNPGVANALNIAAARAIYDGYKFLLTFDDDSRAPIDLVERMQEFLKKHIENEFGLVSVAHSKHADNSTYKIVDFTMTSGSLIDLSIYHKVGFFNEGFFIDGVDTEYCLRLADHGFKSVEISNLFLNHNLGQERDRMLLGYHISYISHSSTRYYYMIRNTIFIAKSFFLKQPVIVFRLLFIAFKEIIKSTFFETERRKRFGFLIKALIDGVLGNYGKLN